MKKSLIAAALCGLILTVLTGCAEQNAPADLATNSTVTADVPLGTKPSDDITAKPAAPTESSVAGTSTPETQIPTEKEESQPAESSPPDVQTEIPKSSETRPVQTNPPKENEPASTEPVQPPQTEQPKPTEPPVTEITKPTEPQPTEPVQPEAPQETEKTTESPVPEFNINHWISYAKSYAERIRLELDSEAVECWDNPITAGADCIYIQRDIESRLNRYNRDEDITAVWIWAEQRADGDYDLYIGYA